MVGILVRAGGYSPVCRNSLGEVGVSLQLAPRQPNFRRVIRSEVRAAESQIY